MLTDTREIEKYKVVSAALYEMDKKFMFWAEHGYTLRGGVSVLGEYCYQAMVKYKD